MGDDRFTSLESRFAWLEHHVTEQDKAMLELAEDLRRLRRRIEALQGRLAASDPAAPPADKDQRPPHY